MSNRTFFDQRYALPGYIFLTIFVLINWSALISMLSDKLSEIFVALLALLSGFPLGFLISQLWYIVFSHFLVGRYGVSKNIYNFLKSKRVLNNDADFNDSLFFSDYIQRLSENKNMLKYAERRWDLIHLLGSTIFALPLGFIFGILYAWRYGYLQTNPDSLQYIFIIVLLACISLLPGLRHVLKEHSMARYIIVQETIAELEKYKWSWEEFKGRMKKAAKHFQKINNSFVSECVRAISTMTSIVIIWYAFVTLFSAIYDASFKLEQNIAIMYTAIMRTSIVVMVGAIVIVWMKVIERYFARRQCSGKKKSQRNKAS